MIGIKTQEGWQNCNSPGAVTTWSKRARRMAAGGYGHWPNYWVALAFRQRTQRLRMLVGYWSKTGQNKVIRVQEAGNRLAKQHEKLKARANRLRAIVRASRVANKNIGEWAIWLRALQF